MSTRLPARREPRIVTFIVVGALLGLLVGGLSYFIEADNGLYGGRTAFGYLAVFGLCLGALAGAVTAAIFAGRRPR